MKKTMFAVLVCLMSFAGLYSEAWGAHVNNPKWNGFPLDWCMNFEQGCGKPAADLFCKKSGFGASTGFQIRPQVNFQTMTIGQNAICDPRSHRCDSFNYIDCQETIKVFSVPTYNGYRLDWCRQFEHECGAPAAQAYCQKNGFSQLVNFHIQPHLNTPTMTIGSNAICNPQFHGCDSFSFVQCKK
jgi:hypothetical protein